MINIQPIGLLQTPATAAWFGWGLISLLTFFALIVYSAPNFITEKYKSIFASVDRRAFSSMSAQVNGNTLVYATLFTVLSWSLALYAVFYPADFSLTNYLVFMLTFILMLCLKAGIIWILCYTFGSKNTYAESVPTYASIMMTTGLPITAGIITYTIWQPGYLTAIICFAPAIIYFCAAVLFTFYEHLRSGWLSYIYLVVYLIIVEITPMVAILNLMKMII